MLNRVIIFFYEYHYIPIRFKINIVSLITRSQFNNCIFIINDDVVSYDYSFDLTASEASIIDH